jgi:hypothetical protein
MMKQIVASLRALPLAVILAAFATLSASVTPAGAQIQQGSVIEDLLKRSQDAYNDLNFLRADTLAHQVLASTGRVSREQRLRAMVLVAASAYPDDPSAQRRARALQFLRDVIRINLEVQVPPELRWVGFDSIVDEARRTAFGMAVTADSAQSLVGPQGIGKITVRSNRTGRFRMSIFQGAMPTGVAVATDSTLPGATGELRFPGMRNERPVFTTGEYTVVITGVDASGRDTLTQRLAMRVEAPALVFAQVPSTMDSTKLLPIRSPRYGLKAIVPAIFAGGAAYAFSTVLRGEGEIANEIAADSKGVAIAGAIAGVTILAGVMDRGRPLPQNVAANKAFGEAFTKSIADAQTENRRRVAEYRTTVRMEGGQ